MNKTRTVLAIALASLFAAAPAVAADDAALTDAVISLWDVADTTIDVQVEGYAYVGARSGASVEQTQVTGENVMLGNLDADATLGDALDGASGNIGVNIASGVGNAQTNNVALSTIDGSSVDAYASAMVFSDQAAISNSAIEIISGDYTASIGDGALAGAVGNVGVNVASGVGNAQGNAMAASVNSAGDVAYATGDSNQLAGDNLFIGLGFGIGLNASLDGGALAGASGNIGVNVAAGVGNVQHNSLSIASNGGL